MTREHFVIYLLANQISPLEVTYLTPISHFSIFLLLIYHNFSLNSR